MTLPRLLSDRAEVAPAGKRSRPVRGARGDAAAADFRARAARAGRCGLAGVGALACLGALASLGAAAPSRAADAGGRFAVDGAGGAPCAVYLDARQKRDASYLRFAGWLEGFTSAMNLYEPDTFDVTPWQTSDLMAAALADYCRANARSNVQQGMAAIARRLMQGRLRVRSPLVRTGRTPLYAETLAIVQGRLRELGFAKAAPSGAFDEGTRQALAAFQRARGLNVTGEPDQPTLFLLLWPRREGR